MSQAVVLSMSPFTERDVETVKEVSRYGGLSIVFSMLIRFLWKKLGKEGAGDDAGKAKNEAEESLWNRLKTQVETLQESERKMEEQIALLRDELVQLKVENARLRTENEFYKHTIDEQIETIASFEAMMRNVKIIDKGAN